MESCLFSLQIICSRVSELTCLHFILTGRIRDDKIRTGGT